MKQYARKYDLKPEKVKDYLIGKIPLGRPAEPEDVAKVALFLASSDSDYFDRTVHKREWRAGIGIKMEVKWMSFFTAKKLPVT